jgi:EAL domain-containing protein (putative c-di-GMP-specific phosphodiesterase class I)
LSYFKKLKIVKGYQHTKLSLNLTPEMFLKEGFASLLNDYTKANEIDNKNVIVEVSENTFVHNLNVCNRMIKTFKAYGFMIAIDDFGSKYSSLAVLETIDYDIIKIDGSFINNLETKNNLEIVKMIAQIGRDSQKIIIAEKVETKEISEILIEHKIYLHQGYYFHKPEKLI